MTRNNNTSELGIVSEAKTPIKEHTHKDTDTHTQTRTHNPLRVRLQKIQE